MRGFPYPSAGFRLDKNALKAIGKRRRDSYFVQFADQRQSAVGVNGLQVRTAADRLPLFATCALEENRKYPIFATQVKCALLLEQKSLQFLQASVFYFLRYLTL